MEGTSGSTGISLASLACTRGHGTVVVMPDDQSSQKSDLLRRLGAGVLVVRNCSISKPSHYVNVARRVWDWQVNWQREDRAEVLFRTLCVQSFLVLHSAALFLQSCF